MQIRTISALFLVFLLTLLSACSGDKPSESQMKNAVETMMKLEVRKHWNAEEQKAFSVEFVEFKASDCIKNGIEVSCSIDSEIVLRNKDKKIDTMKSKGENMIFEKSDGEWIVKR